MPKKRNYIIHKLIGMLFLSLVLAVAIYLALQRHLPIVIGGRQTPEPEFVQFTEKTEQLLPIYTNLSSKEFCTATPLLETVEVVTEAGWRIILDKTRDVSNQLRIVEKTLSSLSPAEVDKLLYIGVDSQGLVYYRSGNTLD